MTASLLKFEQRARYVMAVMAIIGVIAALCLRAGLISKTPFYHDNYWYLENHHANFVIISEYQNEAECRRHEKAFLSCRSGQALIEEARNREMADASS